MSYMIAISGKGGVGKTTIAGLIIQRLIARGCGPVLAVDADPNNCLDGVLGVRVEHTVGGVREETRQIAGKGLAVGISKQEVLELKIAESLVEAEDFDLIAMGRPEGPGCYCYANNVLKQALAQITHPYPDVVLDNEAGLENLSRRIVQRVDLLVLVADPSRRGLETVERLHALAHEMEIAYGKLAIVINRMRREVPEGFFDELTASLGADYILTLPDDEGLARLAEEGGRMADLPEDNPVSQRIDRFLEALPAQGRE